MFRRERGGEAIRLHAHAAHFAQRMVQVKPALRTPRIAAPSGSDPSMRACCSNSNSILRFFLGIPGPSRMDYLSRCLCVYVWGVRAHMCRCIFVLVRACVYVRAFRHACMLAHACACFWMRLHACTRACSCERVRVLVRTLLLPTRTGSCTDSHALGASGLGFNDSPAGSLPIDDSGACEAAAHSTWIMKWVWGAVVQLPLANTTGL
jgi:hypothetical protein